MIAKRLFSGITFPIIFVFFLFLTLQPLIAQEDIQGAADHPSISRYEGASINHYAERDFESFSYPISPEKEGYAGFKDIETAEGRIFSVEYRTPEGVTGTQVFRSYELQLKEKGFEIAFSCAGKDCKGLPVPFSRNWLNNASSQLGNALIGSSGNYLVAKGKSGDQTLVLTLVVGDSPREKFARYRIDIVEIEELDTSKVTVAEVASAIMKEGKIAFTGIQFEFNQSTLQQSSEEYLLIMADYLKSNDQHVLIVGHTDNVGDFKFNIELSQKRAETVVSQLAEKYQIDKSRLTPIGVGMAAPVSSNDNDEGRSKNRRVEMVLK